jgi:hypothetical protein
MWKKEAQLFRLYHAWSIETAILMDLIQKQIKEIQIHVKNPDGSETLYKTTPRFWLEHSIIDKFRDNQEPTAYLPVSKFERFG